MSSRHTGGPGGPRSARPAAVLFDAGGTLVLIDPESMARLMAGFTSAPIDPGRLVAAHYTAMAEYSKRLKRGEEAGWRFWVDRFLDLNGISHRADLADAFGNARDLWHRVVPGAVEAVRAVKALGCRVGVVSNSDGTVASALDKAGFDGLFETVVDSSVVGVSKPDPVIFEIALHRLDVAPEEAWYVGDSDYHDMGGARAAGLGGSVLIDPLGLGPAGQLSVGSISELPALIPSR